MTSALEVRVPRHRDRLDHAPARTDEAIDQIFSFRELARIDEALTMSSRETGLRFTLYVGELGTPTRARAEELHAYSGGNTAEGVLIAVSPGQRVVEVVTGPPRPAGCPTAPARSRCCR